MKTWTSDNLWPEVSVGDVVTKYGHSFQWTKDHLKGHELEPLRKQGDKLADAALPFLGTKTSLHATTRIELLNKVQEPSVLALREQVYSVPEWVNSEQIKRGQEIFWMYLPLCMMTLLNASLVGGFGSPQITQTLRCTAYLGRPDSAWPRLLETALMVQDVMSFGELKIGGRGWTSAINVRLMHAQVRAHILHLPKSRYNSEESGIPINQEDLLSTLIVFSSTVIQCLTIMGIKLSFQQMRDYVAVWRYVGYLMGIDDTLGHFSCINRMMALHQSVMMHLLSPNAASAQIAKNVLEASANQPPFNRSFNNSVAITRYLLGNTWADALDLPQVKWERFFIPVRIFTTRIVVQFGLLLNKHLVMQFSHKAVYFMVYRMLGQAKPNYQFVPIEANLNYKSKSLVAGQKCALLFTFIDPFTLLSLLLISFLVFSIVLLSCLLPTLFRLISSL